MCRRDRITTFCSASRISPHSCVSGTRFECRPPSSAFSFMNALVPPLTNSHVYILADTDQCYAVNKRHADGVTRWNYIALANHMWAIQIYVVAFDCIPNCISFYFSVEFWTRNRLQQPTPDRQQVFCVADRTAGNTFNVYMRFQIKLRLKKKKNRTSHRSEWM